VGVITSYNVTVRCTDSGIATTTLESPYRTYEFSYDNADHPANGFTAGTMTVKLTATAASGYSFYRWTYTYSGSTIEYHSTSATFSYSGSNGDITIWAESKKSSISTSYPAFDVYVFNSYKDDNDQDVCEGVSSISYSISGGGTSFDGKTGNIGGSEKFLSVGGDAKFTFTAVLESGYEFVCWHYKRGKNDWATNVTTETFTYSTTSGQNLLIYPEAKKTSSSTTTAPSFNVTVNNDYAVCAGVSYVSYSIAGGGTGFAGTKGTITTSKKFSSVGGDATFTFTASLKDGYEFVCWHYKRGSYDLSTSSRTTFTYTTSQGEDLTIYPEAKESSSSTTTGGGVWVHNGSTWKTATPYIYNGTAWKSCTAYVYNGSAWVQV
jgi:hypothetical protein